jgi:predicted XRE-type DNA-binding protein
MAHDVQPSSGNVFADLGFSAEDALNLKIRSDLMIEISKLIETRGLTQTAAAKVLRVTQPRISDPVRGKLDWFSVDSLIEMLGHAGASISFVVTTDRQIA